MLTTASTTSADVNNAFTNNQFFSITITPDTYATLDFTQVSFDIARGGTSDTRNIAIRTSLTGTANVLDTFQPTSVRPTFQNKAVDLSVFTGLQDVTEAVTFYFAVATSALDRSLEWDNITFEADFTVPEPSTAILAGLGLAGLTLRRRRNK